MSTKSKLNHYLDLGALGEDFDCLIEFDWYVAAHKAEDDYDELTINAVWIELEGHKINVVDLLSSDKIEELEIVCWEYVEMADEGDLT